MDHRRTPRFPLSTLVKIQQGSETILATSTDINLHGIGVELVGLSDDSETLLISFRLRPAESPITTPARLVWKANIGSKLRIGLEFRDLQVAYESQISDYLSQLAKDSTPS